MTDEDWGYKCPECGGDVCGHVVLMHQKLQRACEKAREEADALREVLRGIVEAPRWSRAWADSHEAARRALAAKGTA